MEAQKKSKVKIGKFIRYCNCGQMIASFNATTAAGEYKCPRCERIIKETP